MSAKHSVRFAAFIGVFLVVAGCGNNDAEIKQYANERGMSGILTVAFSACARDTQRKKLLFPVKDGNLMMKEVPLDVCACQAKTMLSVFQEKKYGGHTTFVDYMANEKKKKKPRLNKRELVADLTPADARTKLQDSLEKCVRDYRTSHADKDAELFEVVPLPVEEPKKEKTAKSS